MIKFLTLFVALFWVGFAAAQDAETTLRKAFDAGQLNGLHSVHMRMGGEVLVDAYFDGEDQNWGQPLGVTNHGPATLHDLRSVTKSITALLYGIAL